MAMKNSNEELNELFREKLISERIISPFTRISIEEVYSVRLNKVTYKHYLAKVPSQNCSYFIKAIKEKENTFAVSEYLMSLSSFDFPFYYPHVLTKPFQIGAMRYIITSYLDGKTLREEIEDMPLEELKGIFSILSSKLKSIHSITSKYYTAGDRFSYLTYPEIMSEKLKLQFSNSNLYPLVNRTRLSNLIPMIQRILLEANYSSPTLIHMDIKPDNIVISPSGDVNLIDFELARFGDLDYEWVNLLIKGLLPHSRRFKEFILYPTISENFIFIDQALKIDKYKVYLLYHAINIYLYYLRTDRTCPAPIISLILDIIHRLSS